MIPSNISKKHIIMALSKIDEIGVPDRKKSRKFVLKFNKKFYPPKYVVALANKYTNGTILASSEFSGGDETNQFLKKLGFEILEKNHLPYNKKSKSYKVPKNKTKKHNERCKECKERVFELLQEIFGEVKKDYDLNLPSKLDSFKNKAELEVLNNIYTSLGEYRNYKDFVKANKLANVDFFIPDPGFIVEFDESQHFTNLRKIALENYPKELELGFDKQKWIDLCERINAKDNDPIYRDEQRAWYDTIRDFAPLLKDLSPTIRLFASDYKWCNLNPKNPNDIDKFMDFLNLKTKNPITIIKESDPFFARIIITNDWTGNPIEARNIFEKVYKFWPENNKVKFLLTCGGFIQFKWPESIIKDDIGDNKNPNNDVIDILIDEAEKYARFVLKDGIGDNLSRYTDYITLGIDSFKEKISTTQNTISQPHIELVFLIDLKNDKYYWTGKSYPTNGQEKGLVRITKLNKHIFDLNIGKTLILGCHDLSVYNPRFY